MKFSKVLDANGELRVSQNMTVNAARVARLSLQEYLKSNQKGSFVAIHGDSYEQVMTDVHAACCELTGKGVAQADAPVETAKEHKSKK